MTAYERGERAAETWIAAHRAYAAGRALPPRERYAILRQGLAEHIADPPVVEDGTPSEQRYAAGYLDRLRQEFAAVERERPRSGTHAAKRVPVWLAPELAERVRAVAQAKGETLAAYASGVLDRAARKSRSKIR